MATFTSDRYPQLRIGGIVRFEDGVCTTTAREALAQLRKFAASDEYGITEVKAPGGRSGGKHPGAGSGRQDEGRGRDHGAASTGDDI
ncbi:hypothetical protein AB0K09_00480 [Streptomyces sp. NPDC049577]|uniref:hypothetical protein n=1 Tax=Streptomyces sp. NPDC049577 TaxID=3155153 RepID=UPI00341F51A2